MHTRASLFTLLCLGSLPFVAQAYYLSFSCRTGGINSELLTEQINSAFAMARDTSTYFGDARLADVRRWILGTSPSPAIGFYNLLAMGTVGQRSMQPDNIIFYCDTSALRVEQRQMNGRPTTITHNDELGWGHLGDGVKQCDATTGVSGVMAYTANQPNAGQNSYIVLCPWYLQRMQVLKVSGGKRFLTALKNPLQTLDQGLDKLFKDGKPAIQTAALLDHTVLHELTHTTYAGASKDIEGPEDSYGWSNARRLSNGPQPWNNADSLAYFALAARFILSGTAQITEDGNVIRP